MKTSWLWVVLALAPASLAGCGNGDGAGAMPAAAQQRGGGFGGGGRSPAGSVVPVDLIEAREGDIARSVTVSGVIEPIRTVTVNSQLSGALLAVQVEEGDRVVAGDVLARLDDRELQAQLEAAEAAYEVAESAYERAEQLRERQVITLPEYERDRTAYTAARAQLDQIRTRIDYATVQAPISGVITTKEVEAGDVVGNQMRLFTVADLSEIVVRVGVSELDVVELAVGNPVSIALDAFPGRSLEGRIRRVFPTADPGTRLVPVEVRLTGEAASIARPGFLARTTFELSAREGVVLIPVSALVTGAGSQSVFVVEDGTAVRRTVTTGLTSVGQVEILSGLSPGDRVVTAGSGQLRDGASVRVMGEGGEAADDVPTSSGG